MCFFCYQNRHIIQNLFQKLSIFKIESSSFEIWDCQWHKTFSATPAFTALILLFLFQCCGFNFTILLFFLMAINVFATSWVTFSNTRIIECFSYFLIWFSHGSLMEINSTHVYFRCRIILCFNDEKQEDKNTFKDHSQSEYFIY